MYIVYMLLIGLDCCQTNIVFHMQITVTYLLTLYKILKRLVHIKAAEESK